MSDDIVREFLVESNENLDLLDRELIALEKDPGNRGRLASVFRTIHTIKGTCGFLGFTKLESVAHVGENLLSRLRDGEIVLNPEITTVLLQMVDATRQMLGEIEATGNDGNKDYSQLLDNLKRLHSSGGVHVPPPKTNLPAPDTASEQPALSGVKKKISGHPEVDPHAIPASEISKAANHNPAHGKMGEVPLEKQFEDVSPTQQLLENRHREPSAETIRVGVNLLDKLMTLVGELVLARNQLLQFSNFVRDPGFHAISQRMNLIATDLQGEVMKTRMQPIGNIWSKFPRTVRDVALSCQKQVNIEMEGQETELDKTIIEAIKDPLTHLVRNAVDHGIESPEERIKAGKPPTGRIILRAFHEGGQVNIEITDDGAGLNTDRLRQKAMERGLINAEQATRMQEREVFNLIFLPGFSTAAKVTNVSGRGVGMDVVKTNVEKIGGVVDIQSTMGHGTTVRVKIPLTLAIIPALVVRCANQRYAIPQVNLLELVRLELEHATKVIELIQGVPVYRLRGRLLPLVYLNRELHVQRENQSAADDDAVNIVVLQADERQFGLVVDEITDTEEIVVKPLGKQLKGIKTFAGSTIMGDGRVALILDVLGIAQVSNVISEVRARAIAEREAESFTEQTDKQTLLLFSGPDDGHMAVHLDHVGRLEEFPLSTVERAGKKEVVQYRGEILPLLFLSELLEERRSRSRRASKPAKATHTDQLQGIVYSSNGKRFGLVVERILDIVEESIQVKSPPSRFGVLYTAVIQGRVTELLDVPSLLQAYERKGTGNAQPERVGV